MSGRTRLDRGGIDALPQRHRVRLVNSLSGFKSANLVGTADGEGRTACCIVSSVVHLGSNPALLGVVFRPPGDDSHNYHNLAATGYFTLSHITVDIHEEAHQTSARYAAGVSEFEAVGLTPHWHGEGEARSRPPRWRSLPSGSV